MLCTHTFVDFNPPRNQPIRIVFLGFIGEFYLQFTYRHVHGKMCVWTYYLPGVFKSDLFAPRVEFSFRHLETQTKLFRLGNFQ